MGSQRVRHDWVTFTSLHLHTYMCVCLINRFSRVRLFTILSTVDHQTPLSMGFSRQEYWKLGCHGPPPGDLPDPGTETAPLAVPALPVNSLPLSHWGSPIHMNMFFFRFLPLIGYYKILHMVPLLFISVFASGSDSKESACNAGDPSSSPGLGRSPILYMVVCIC